MRFEVPRLKRVRSNLIVPLYLRSRLSSLRKLLAQTKKLKNQYQGWHVPRHGEAALQAVCEEFDSLLVHRRIEA